LLGPGDQVQRLEPTGKLALAHRLLAALGGLLRPPGGAAPPHPHPGADP
jgi:hypothetical protein